MNAQRSLSVLKIGGVLLLALVVASLAPHAAEAQARGTLQATATVVDTRTSFASLQAAQGAIASVVSAGRTPQAVATVAQVSVARPAERPNALVVTIDYSRN